MKKTTSGIYRIDHADSGRCYVGSSVNIPDRWSWHRTYLKRNRHSNQHLQNAWNKYGESAFQWTVVETVGRDLLVEREQFWMDALGAYTNGYNLRPVADSNRGNKHTPEARARMSAAQKGKKGIIPSAEVRAKMAAAHRGRTHPSEVKAKIKAAHIRRGSSPKFTEEQRNRSILSRRGAKRTAEQRERIKVAVTKWWSDRLASGWKAPQQSAETVAKRVATRARNKMLGAGRLPNGANPAVMVYSRP